MNCSVRKHVLQMLCTLALCTATALGALPRQTPGWMKNVDFTIETGLISLPETLKGIERDAFQAALKDALSESFRARGNFEDAALYFFESGDGRAMLSIVNSRMINGTSSLDDEEVDEVDGLTADWDTREFEDRLMSNLSLARSEVLYEVLSDISSSDSEEVDADDMPVDRSSSGIGTMLEERTDALSSDSCQDREFQEALKRQLLCFLKTPSGQQRISHIARRLIKRDQTRSSFANGFIKEVIQELFTEVINPNPEVYLVTKQEAILRKLGVVLGYSFPLSNNLTITPEIGIDYAGVTKLKIPALGLTFEQTRLHMPVAARLHGHYGGLTLGYDFDLLLSLSYHKEKYAPPLALLPVAKDLREVMPDLPRLSGRIFFSFDLRLGKGFYLCYKVKCSPDITAYSKAVSRDKQFDKNFMALVREVSASFVELNVGLDLLKLLGQR